MKLKDNNIYNLILPFFFFEFGAVAIAFIFVVLLETLVVRLFIRHKFFNLFEILAKANFLTTFVGYFLQNVIRFIFGLAAYVALGLSSDNPVFDAIVGNVGIGTNDIEVMDLPIKITILTGTIIALIISIVLERRILIKKLDPNLGTQIITKTVIITNVLSYALLALWIYFSYMGVITLNQNGR